MTGFSKDLKKRVHSTLEEASSRSECCTVQQYAADAAAHNGVFVELMF